MFCGKCRTVTLSKQSDEQPVKRMRYTAQQAVKAVMVSLHLSVSIFSVILPDKLTQVSSSTTRLTVVTQNKDHL